VKKLISRITLFRHGESNYKEYELNGKRPDLTEEGISNIKRGVAGALLYAYEKKSMNFKFISSPAWRTMDSIEMIKERLDCGGDTIIEKTLRPIEIKDKEKFSIILSGNAGYSDIPYTRDPIYDDPALFEPRSEIKKRFYIFLSSIIREDIKNPNKEHKLVCSHYEVLYHFAQDLFRLDYNRGDKTLGCGEAIDIWIYKKMIPYLAYFDVHFRNFKASQVPYDYVKNELIL
jgi:broad specificity phosphatase PhoE